MNEEQIKAAKAAWQRDPDTAAKALLGMIAEEVFIQAIRGCNQHNHKPGCPDADGGSVVQDRGNAYEEVKRVLDKVAREDKGVNWKPKSHASTDRGNAYEEVKRALDKAQGKTDTAPDLPGNAAELKTKLEKDIARLKKELDAEEARRRQGNGSFRVYMSIKEMYDRANENLRKLTKSKR